MVSHTTVHLLYIFERQQLRADEIMDDEPVQGGAKRPFHKKGLR